MEKSQEEGVLSDNTPINGRTQGPQGTDGTDADHAVQDNNRSDLVHESANGLDSVEVGGGKDGRNNRGIGSMDMDSKNGVLRLGDQDNSTMEVPDEALDQAVASSAKTNTATADVTTAGPDDYASADTVGVPDAQKEAKESAQREEADEPNKDNNSGVSQQETEHDVAETGTSIDHQPTY